MRHFFHLTLFIKSFFRQTSRVASCLLILGVLSFISSASASENPDYSQYSEAYLQELAAKGDMEAVFTQAYNLLFDGESLREDADFETAIKLFQKAHDNGHETANSFLTLYYSGGFGHAPDLEKANQIAIEAAERGSGIAQLNYGLTNINSEEDLVADRALAYLERAALDDSVKDHAIPALIEIYYGVNDNRFEDYSKGRDWALSCVDTLPENAFCSYILARDYENGWSGDADADKSLSYYRTSAEIGDMRAQWILGMHYLNGDGVAVDEATAFEWVQKSAAQNYVEGQISLGVMYALGQGTQIDKAKSFATYEKAAKHNSGHAMRSIGAMYCSGEAPITDRKLCAAALILAGEMNDDLALPLLSRFFQIEKPREIQNL